MKKSPSSSSSPRASAHGLIALDILEEDQTVAQLDENNQRDSGNSEEALLPPASLATHEGAMAYSPRAPAQRPIEMHSFWMQYVQHEVPRETDRRILGLVLLGAASLIGGNALYTSESWRPSFVLFCAAAEFFAFATLEKCFDLYCDPQP